jgi:hypothetical protein
MADCVTGSLVELRHKGNIFFGILESVTKNYWDEGIDGYHIKWKVHISPDIKNTDGSIGITHVDFTRVLTRDEFRIL